MTITRKSPVWVRFPEGDRPRSFPGSSDVAGVVKSVSHKHGTTLVEFMTPTRSTITRLVPEVHLRERVF